MKTRIKMIPLALATEGNRLGAPVQDAHGHILLMDGIDLNESMLAGLHRHNVTCVSILEDDLRSEEELAIERTRMTDHIDALFDKTEQTANLASLHRLILEYRLKSLS